MVSTTFSIATDKNQPNTKHISEPSLRTLTSNKLFHITPMSNPPSSRSPSFNLFAGADTVSDSKIVHMICSCILIDFLYLQSSSSKSPRVANLTTSVGDMSINKGSNVKSTSSRAQRKSTRKCTKRKSLKKVPKPDTKASRLNRQNQQKGRAALIKKKRSVVSRGGKPVRVGSRQQPTRKAKEESPFFALTNISPADVKDAIALPLPPADESGL